MVALTRAQVEQRLERNSNDIDAIYDILADHGQQLTQIQAKLVDHDARFEAIDARFDGVDARFDGVDARFDGVDARFDRIEETLVEVLRRLPAPPEG